MAPVLRTYLSLIVLGWTTVSVAGAQGAPQAAPEAPPPPTTTLTGTAIDSLHDRPLGGASVVVDGTNITGVSDSLGHFRLDHVPVGAHQVAIYHPLLDSL